MKKILLLVLLFLVAVGAAGYLAVHIVSWRERAAEATPTPTPRIETSTEVELPPEGTVLTPQFTQPPEGTPNIVVTAPASGDGVSLPFSVSGFARVFESTVNIDVRDSEGRFLYRDISIATAPDTGFFGSFSKTITFFERVPRADPEKILLEVLWYSPKDGEPLDIVRIPLNFEKPRDSRIVKVFFSNTTLYPQADCASVFPVERLVGRTSGPAAAAIELLLRGPTEEEKNAGYFSSINPGVRMPRIAIAQGPANIDFSKDLDEGVAGSCRVVAIRAQIEQTLYQFPSVSGVTISIEGRTEDILQP